MSRQEEILYIGKEILINCKKSERMVDEYGSTVEMHIERILPLFQNLLRSWDKECKKDKEKTNPIDENRMDSLYKWVLCEMRGYNLTDKLTEDDIKNIIRDIIPSRNVNGYAVPCSIEVLEISLNQGDKTLEIGGLTLTNLDMRKILSEVYANIIHYVNEIVSEIDIELPVEGQWNPWMQYQQGPADEPHNEPEEKDDSPVNEDASLKWIRKNYGNKED